MKFEKIELPKTGSLITLQDNVPVIPDDPIIPYIEGDGIGPDIMTASRRVWDAAVEKAYEGKKKIAWMEVYAGEKAKAKYDDYLPKDTVEAIKKCVIAIKGPLSTPIGGGIRSLNVAMRQILNLYACVRPIYYFNGVPSPVVYPQRVNMIIFRENTEDVYSGIEWKQGSAEALKVIDFLKKEFNITVQADSGIGIKPISITGTNNLMRKALQYAIKNNRKSVTIVHKGNIMKFTEGAFKTWAYELAKNEFGQVTITEDEVYKTHNGKVPHGKIVIKDRIADSMFQQVLIRPDEYDVLAMPNLNGDYMSDALAAQIGGLGMAPGGNIGEGLALFEASHGTAPKYAGLDKINPCALMLSGVLMLEYMGWDKAAKLIKDAVAQTILQKKVTYDLARQMPEKVVAISTSAFASMVITNL